MESVIIVSYLTQFCLNITKNAAVKYKCSSYKTEINWHIKGIYNWKWGDTGMIYGVWRLQIAMSLEIDIPTIICQTPDFR